MNQRKTLFLGTPSFAIPFLKTLLKSHFFKVVGIVTQENSPSFSTRSIHSKPRLNPVENWIYHEEKLNYKIPILKPKSLSDQKVKNDILKLEPDIVLIVAFGQILKPDFLDLFPNRVFNIHASLLPRWRGAAPIQRALLAGDTETGVSLQMVDPKLDRGSILGERKISIVEEMDAQLLHDELSQIGTSLIENELWKYLNGKIRPLNQEELIKMGRKTSYAHKLKKEDFYIKWENSSRFIALQIRALTLNGGARSLRNKKILKIHKAKSFEVEKGEAQRKPNEHLSLHLLEKLRFSPPGEVLKIEKDSFYVACGEGYLQIVEVQPESRKKMKVSEYIKGYALNLKDRLENKI